MKKEIPILFSTAMVQAILAGRKTMTRRVVKFPLKCPTHQISFGDSGQAPLARWAKWQPGDLLWVRENWQIIGWSFEDGSALVRYENGDTLDCDCPDPTEDSGWLLKHVEKLENGGYYAIDPENKEFFKATGKKQPFKPCIHLPKSFSRIWLEVTDVRAERLQEISEADAIAEGVEQNRDGSWHDYVSPERLYQDAAKPSFQSLWIKINGEESWDANPWVWVVSFKVLSTTGRPVSLNKTSDDFWPMRYKEGDNSPIA